MTTYDLNDIADALRDVVSVDSWNINGQMVKVSTWSEVPGTASVPALFVELDDVTYDLSMGGGADSFVFLLHLVVDSSDSKSGQRLTRQLLSRGGAAASIKAALEKDDTSRTLGGLVSYAVITGTRTIGSINYGGVTYLGATLEVQVMSA